MVDDAHRIACPVCGEMIVATARVCRFCGEQLRDMPRSAERKGDATGGIIPYKNVPALIAYYCGLFALFPVLGLFIGIAGVILGIKGLKNAKQFPEVRGQVHAWIGIIGGGLFGMVWLLLDIIIVALVASNR